jgi:hypothetical protein
MAMDTSKLMGLMKQKKAALKQKAKTLKPNPGANRYVLLQGWRKGEEHVYFHEFGQHFIKDSAGVIQAVYPCMDATYGRPCPVCEGIGKAVRMTDAGDEETLKQLDEAACGARKQKYLLNVLALDTTEAKTPQILEVGKSVFGQIVEIVEEWASGVFDEEKPQIITINRDGKGLTTKYTVQISAKRSTMPDDVMGKLNNLDEYVLQENEENQKRALNAINNVAGLLPASAEDRPKTSASSLDDQREEGLRASERNIKAAKASPALDDELDDLLGEFEDSTGTEG